MMTIALIAGIWTTTCIQTQIANVNSGYMKETYTFEKNGSFERKRDWYSDPKCLHYEETDIESGSVEVGDKISTFFIPGEVLEADFSTQSGVDLGAISVKGKTLRMARGVSNSNMRNTMLSLFEFVRQ